MNCQICNRPSKDKYCNSCKHIRSIYTIHKLYEKIPLNEKFNKDTLTIKKIKNIEEYDLELLAENEIIIKDKYNNYKWTNLDNINTYLEKHDKNKSKLTPKGKKEKIKEVTIDKIIPLLEKNYNLTDTFDLDEFTYKTKTNKKQAKKLLGQLTDKKLVKKSFYGNYKLNYPEIIKYKQKNKTEENKIQRLNNIKQNTKTKDVKTQKKRYIKKTPAKNTTTTKNITSKKNTTVKKTTTIKNKVDVDKNKKEKKSTKDNIPLNRQEELIPAIRKYINENLVILPRNVKDNDLTLNELYDEYKEHNQINITQEEFNKYFHRTINTYPHIRHKKEDGLIRYNIKSRKTPQITLNNLQKNNKKFTYNPDCQIQLKENTLKLTTDIKDNEIAQLYNLVIYTQENITEYYYQKMEDKIHVEITYDLEDENPELWTKFLNSYNLG